MVDEGWLRRVYEATCRVAARLDEEDGDGEARDLRDDLERLRERLLLELDDLQ